MDLTGYSRATGDEDARRVELEPVIEDALRLIRRTSPVDEISFDVEISPDIACRGVAGELQQVFVNLLKNAVDAVLDRHGNLGGRVGLTVRIEDDVVVAEVADDGSGIPSDKVPLVFDPFYTTKPPGQGTGLGLNVVYRIVTKHRGDIKVQSVLGEGTRFTLRLPVAANAD